MITDETGNILIIGGSSGIGLETGKTLCETGRSVTLVARSFDNKTDQERQAVQSLRQTFGNERCRLMQQDVAQLEKLEAFSKKVKEVSGPIDGLVFCAGAQKTLPLSMTKPGVLKELFTINTFSAIELVRLFSKAGYYREGASFVLLSSLAPHEASPGKAAYSASKAALEGFVCSASQELITKGIRLNAVAPGIVKTAMSEEFLNKMSPAQLQSLEASYPLGFGEPLDITWVIEFLLSQRSRWICGKTFLIDGGHLPGGK
ncbi:MAG: SDR family oxidoreductase [Thermotogaceae bacterium]|nr:SDR family oxidoreductase [Thermotogaceae bacterium]